MDKILGLIIVFAIMFIISMLLIMWGWSLFMVPMFGMKSITFAQAFGLTLLASAFKSSSTNKK